MPAVRRLEVDLREGRTTWDFEEEGVGSAVLVDEMGGEGER